MLRYRGVGLDGYIGVTAIKITNINTKISIVAVICVFYENRLMKAVFQVFCDVRLMLITA